MKTKAGRPKGSKNKATQEVRERFKELVENNLSKFQDDLDSLQPYERLTMVMQLARFVLPTLKTTELKTDIIDREPVKIVFAKIKN